MQTPSAAEEFTTVVENDAFDSTSSTLEGAGKAQLTFGTSADTWSNEQLLLYRSHTDRLELFVRCL